MIDHDDLRRMSLSGNIPALRDAFAEYEEAIASAKEHNANAVFVYEDPKGNKAARSHIYELRQIKARVEARRKELKAGSLEYGRQVDGTAKRITADVEEMIAVHEAPLKAIEAREAARVASHEAALAAIVADELPPDSAGLRAELERVEAIETGDSWQEFRPRAQACRGAQLARIKALIEQAEQAEAQAAELERLRREQAEREQRERDERIAREARERAEAEAADRERKAAEAAAAREAALRAEAERKAAEIRKREADQAHRARVIAEAAEAIAKVDGGAQAIVEAIVAGEIPRVTVSF
jgi:hypothetical protein